ncbi:MAG: ATP-binding cassette domain-containing protein, partial [Clostridia bacterium]
PLRSLGSAFHVAMNGASAGHKIIELLALPNPEWGEGEVVAKDIAFENVTFSYNGDRNVLKNVTMTFPEKGMTAIVGESGSGKSTVVNLIMGSNRAASGKVIIGGKEISNLSQKSLFSRLAVVSYNTYIFNQSVKANFRMAKPDCSDQEIIDTLKAVNLDRFIKTNGGLDKVISEDANNISGGQKQRLALAVNLIADKNIYIFDEATSNIDIESEAIIMKNIKKLSQRASVIVISHRLANVIAADKIYFMQKGEVKEQGTHIHLVELKGGYARLFLEQKRLEEGYKNRPQEVVA